jgi:haloalkane dehalogenase
LYPFQSHWLDLDGVRYHYLDEGPRDAPPVVMLHGNPTWSFYYRTLIPDISREYRVVVPDHVGCGLSDKPQDYPYTLEQHIANLGRLIAHLGLPTTTVDPAKRLTLLMHDWGGMIGMGYATRHPEKIARFVVLNTAAFVQPNLPLRIKMCRLPVLGDLLIRRWNGFARLALPWATVHRERLTPQVRAGYLAPYDCWENRIAVLRFVEDIPFERGHRSRQAVEDIEANLYLFEQHPMLIIWGAQDFVFTVRDFLAGWEERFPYAEVRVVEDAGHYVVEDAHERIVPWVLAFLRGEGS